ncbi:MAG: hypothetical protein JWQ04_2165, partial [Pedosphaera sp.]|nr:hypothetical protein [Pedosphaera sp.]
MRLSPYLPVKYYLSFLSFLVRQATRAFSFERRPSVVGILMRTYVKRPEWFYYPGVRRERPQFLASP